MVIEKKKRNTFNKYESSIFMLFCFLSFVLIVESRPNYELNPDQIVIKQPTEAVIEGDYEKDSVPAQTLRPNKLSRVITAWRVRPPTTYTVKFDSFATMASLAKNGLYETRPFYIDGYKWTFQIYPNGNNANGQVSVYVRIDNSSFIGTTQNVFAEVKFFVYNRVQDRYWVHHETDAVRFHSLNPVYGVQRFRATSLFSTTGQGYIFDGGQSTFGVDIFVAQSFNHWEVFSFVNNTPSATHTWEITDFSTRYHEYYRSGWFFLAGKSWDFQLYPQGDGSGRGRSLSVYLLSATDESAYLKANLRVLNQIGSNNVVNQIEGWSSNGWGSENLISLSTLNNPSNGFLVGDTLKIQIELLAFTKLDFA